MSRVFLIVGLAIVLVGSLNLFRARSAPAKTFEYNFVDSCNEQTANSWGAQGWEMQSAAEMYAPGTSNSLDVCVFKRPKE